MRFKLVRNRLLLLLCLLVSKVTATHAQVILSGMVKGLKRNSTVTLGQTYIEENIDSLTAKTESFRFDIKDVRGDVYFVGITVRGIDYGMQYYLQGNANLHFVLDKNMRQSLSGSPLAIEQNQFYKGIERIENDLKQIKIKHPEQDSAELEKKSALKEATYCANWVSQHKNSPFSVAVIYLYMQDVSTTTTEPLYNSLSKEATKNNLLTERMPYWFAKRKIIDPVPVGSHLPDVRLADTSGKRLPLSSLIGKGYTLIDIWASWCAPCRASTPELAKLIHIYPEDKLKIISISADTSGILWKQAIIKDGMSWQQLSDLKGTDAGFMKSYSIYAYPTYIILSSEGAVLSKPVTIDRVKDKLIQILAM